MGNFRCIPRLLLIALGITCPWTWVYGAVEWDGSVPITTNVVDQNLNIDNSSGFPVYLANRIYVEALTQDVIVTVTTDDAIVTSSNQLHFFAATGHTITLQLGSNSLILTGSTTQFLVTFSGLGNMVVNFDGNSFLDIGLTATTEPGVVFADILPNGSGNQITFQYGTGGDVNANRGVVVGNNSTLTFISPSGNFAAEGDFVWDSSTNFANTGRLVLEIENNGGVITSPATLFGDPGAPFVTDISFVDTAPDVEAFFDTINTATSTDFSGLLIINNNLTWNLLESNPFCETPAEGYNLPRKGFILGANGVMTVDDGSYIDYVVTVTNITVYPNIPVNILDEPCERFLTQVIKDRNAAAFIIDGNPNILTFLPATIDFVGHSALYLRSGVNCQGDVNTFVDPDADDPIYSFTVSPDQNFKNEGTIVFDVEGELVMNGDNSPTGESAFQILSLQVTPTGGSVLITDSTDTEFPLRTFARDSNGLYVQYGTACAFVNNLWWVRNNMHIQHTDMLHPIFYNGLLVEPSAIPFGVVNNPLQQSAATYIGGDRQSFNCPDSYPVDNRIMLTNSFFDVHTSGAMTGVDLTIREDAFASRGESVNNSSQMVFYGNGRCIDQGTGRVFVMGTEVGCEASDFQTIIDRDAHIDIISSNTLGSAVLELSLTTSLNNTKITEGIIGDISNQFSVHTLYLGWGSNISVGTQGIVSTPVQCSFTIAGSFFSLMTQGGTTFDPSSGATTGQGSLFVDTGGLADVSPLSLRANMGMMGVISGDGIIDLPKSNVYFSPRVGLAQWQLDLTQPSQQIIIPANVQLSDYTLDWQNITHDFCNTATPFVPYEPANTPAPGLAPAVTNANLTGLPIIQGYVEQFQVKNSRLGNQANILVDGGWVREFVFETGNPSTSLPLAILALQNNALVGLGTASRSTDSVDAEVVLGINGVMLIANGDATIQLNTNTIINNLCHVLTGTAFGVSGENRLEITSVVPTELRVKSGGFLDLSQFTTINQTLVIGGRVNLVLEPGAQVLMGGGNLLIQDQAQVFCEPNTNLFELSNPVGNVTYSDDWRVRFMGSGRVTIKEDAQFVVPRDAVIGIEPYRVSVDVVTPSNQSWLLSDNSAIQLGSVTQYGGVFQIGSTSPFDIAPLVTFTLILDGIGSTVDINSQGMLGLGVGIAFKPQTAPNTWLVGNLGGVGSISLINREGFLKNQQIYPGDNKLAGLLAIAQPVAGTPYTFQFDQTNGEILGGGNMVLTTTTSTGVAPIVLATALIAPSGFTVTPSIMSSELQLVDQSKWVLATQVGNTKQLNNVSGSTLFNYLSINGYTKQSGKTAAISQSSLGQTTIGFIDDQSVPGLLNITRLSGFPVRGLNNTYVNAGGSLSVGTVGMSLNGQNVQIFEINPGNP